MGLIILLILALLIAGIFVRYTRLEPPTQSPCTGDCNQGRNCTCCGAKNEGEETTLCPAWPFPCENKP
jgi:hypothetical protein